MTFKKIALNMVGESYLFHTYYIPCIVLGQFISIHTIILPNNSIYSGFITLHLKISKPKFT